jgi:tRNA nucleotidyltransferase (CCA-adding enzyme)
MARDEAGALIDPFRGASDLAAGVLRHVSPAFAEDPLRVLRVARFAARFGFVVAPETEALMRSLTASGELLELSVERVWQELARGMMEPHPSRMLAVLRECGALAQLLPEVDALYGVPQPVVHHPEIDTGVHVALALDYAAAKSFSLPVRYAVLAHDLGKGRTPAAILPKHHAHESRSVRLADRLSDRLRAPSECRDVARLVAQWHGVIHRVDELRPQTLMSLFTAVDVFRRPDRLELVMAACECDAMSRPGRMRGDYMPPVIIRSALESMRAVDTTHVARQASQRTNASGEDIAGAIRAARLRALRDWRATRRIDGQPTCQMR